MKLYESNKTVVYKQKIEGFTNGVIIKFLKTKNPTEQQLNRFYHEYDITNQLKSKYIRKAIKKTIIDGKPAVVLEYFDGSNLLQIKELDRFILLAGKIVEALGEIHKLNIIHKDINPQNILVTKNNEVKIIDFEISSKYSLKTQNLGNPEALEGTLNYISPEQTGRMNRTLDYRSDFYSLGVTFYQIFTGRLPFEHSDPLQLIHAHIATVPVAPNKINNKIPQILSNIILKLLSKNAEDRYQSAFGLKHDLQQLSKSSKLLKSSFKLGEKDFSGKLIIPEKLYGREKETKQLLDIYKKISSANKELLLVAGFSGTGKSMLVHEIHKKVTENNGIYIEGNFDQFQKDIPYHALTIAFTNFVDIILHQTDENLLYWKNLISKAIGNIGKILTDLIPDFELLIGKQADIPKLEGEQAQNRFNYLWQSFMQAICNKQHPIVLFIDDLQWADFSSLKLIKNLFSDPDIEHFMCVTAYRNNEVDSTHIFMQSIEELKKQETAISKIEIKNLTKEDILNLFTDTLSGTKLIEIKNLVELIFSKTQGNAFFTIQFIKMLYEEKLLIYNFEKAVWQWKIAEIENIKITENVVELLSKKIQKLPKTTQQLLQTASCIGNKFSLAMLQTVADKRNLLFQSKTFNFYACLETAIFAGLLIPLKNNKYKFVHDRIKQAIYQEILDADKNNFHLQIGRLLIKKYVNNEKLLTFDNINDNLKKRIFDIVNQINFGLKLINSEDEKRQFIKLNIIAGKKAESAAAYTVALTYFETALKLLDKNSWNTDYKLTLEINENIAKLCYLSKKYEKTEKIVEHVLNNTTKLLDEVKITIVLIQLHREKMEYQKVIKIGLKIMKMLGTSLPEQPSKLLIIKEFITTKVLVGNKDVEQIINLPKMTNKNKIAISQIIEAIITTAYMASPDLFAVLTFKLLKISAKYGNSVISPYAYSGYSVILAIMNDIKNSTKFGELAIKTLQKTNAEHYETRVLFVVNSYCYIRTQRVEEICTNLKQVAQIAYEIGDFEFQDYCLTNSSLYYNNSIVEQQKIINSNISIFKKKNSIYGLQLANLYFQYFQNLTSLNNNFSLTGEYFDEKQELQKALDSGSFNILSHIYNLKLCLNIFYNNTENAKNSLAEIEKYKKSVEGQYYYAYTILYISLVSSMLYSENKDKKYLKNVKKQIKQMKLWAKHCPANYQHKYYLMQAERMRVTGKIEQAKEYFDKAIFGAKQENMYSDEALAWQLAARFYIKINKTHLAEYYMQNAHNAYKKWGAFAVCNYIEQQHPTLIYTNNNKTDENKTEIINSETVMMGNNATVFETGNSLDMSSVIKASQSLSGEVKLEKLLKNMMQIIIENAGADSGLIITNDNNKYNIQAEYNHKKNVISVLQNENIENSKKISINIIKYVIRTRKVLVLDNAEKNSTYEKDEYIKNNKVKSVLCQPIIHKNKLVAILYLENNISVSVFTEQRLDTINMLSSQIAISIENALLYENLEEKVAERTKEVQLQKQEILEKNEELNQQNEEIQATADSLQKANDEITNKNEHITASMRYAKTIQTAILPFDERIKKHLDLFILFRPKDIVSGDFYWFTYLSEKGGYSAKTFIAAVDCTGHGVPGAFMSMIGMQLLNKIINEDKILNPAEILLKLHNGIVYALKQKETENTDGMDVCLCRIEEKPYKDKKDLIRFKVTFAGAKRPLLYFENKENKLSKINGDRKIIGGKIRRNTLSHFSNKEIVLQKNDLLYLTTDGYIDQNNKERKRYGTEKFINILTEIAIGHLAEQKQILETELDNWQGNEEQRDDITIVGIKL